MRFQRCICWSMSGNKSEIRILKDFPALITSKSVIRYRYSIFISIPRFLLQFRIEIVQTPIVLLACFHQIQFILCLQMIKLLKF